VLPVVHFAASSAVSTQEGEATPASLYLSGVRRVSLGFRHFSSHLDLFYLRMCVSSFLVTREPPQVQGILCLHLFSENFSYPWCYAGFRCERPSILACTTSGGLRSMRGLFDGVCPGRGYEAMLL
jgi:hypothetical protein